MGFRFGALGCACLLFLGFWLYGCGAAEEVEREVEEVAEDAIDTIEVNEMEFSLDPADITLNQPGTYVFRANNVGNVVHSLAIEGQGIEEETPNIQPGESSQLKVNLDPGPISFTARLATTKSAAR